MGRGGVGVGREWGMGWGRGGVGVGGWGNLKYVIFRV